MQEAVAPSSQSFGFMQDLFTSSKKDARLEAKISSSQKDFILKAAHLEGLDLSSFVISAAVQKAREVFQESRALFLSKDEYRAFCEFLEHKQEPTEALKQLAALDDLSER
jgi:uncharacterized protein (DUF1778 family)